MVGEVRFALTTHAGYRFYRAATARFVLSPMKMVRPDGNDPSTQVWKTRMYP